MEARAIEKYILVSPRKARLVIDMIRGKKAQEALSLLKFVPNAAAQPVYKAVRSAMANAENNYYLSPDDLYIKTITADDGPRLRRFRPRAHGRVGRIQKRMSHITVVVEDRQPKR